MNFDSIKAKKANNAIICKIPSIADLGLLENKPGKLYIKPIINVTYNR